MQETLVQSLGQKDPLEKEMATCFSVLAWEIPWTEEPGGLQFTESQGVSNDLATEQQQMYNFRVFNKEIHILTSTRGLVVW